MMHLWPNGSATIPAVSEEFGWRTWTSPPRMHNGIDLVGWSQVRASAAGYVSFSGWYGTGGNTVKIKHDDGTETTYMHHRELWVVVGQRVQQGTIVGIMGTTGDSTGVHSHFETRDYPGAAARNPRGFIAEHSSGASGGGGSLITITETEDRMFFGMCIDSGGPLWTFIDLANASFAQVRTQDEANRFGRIAGKSASAWSVQDCLDAFDFAERLTGKGKLPNGKTGLRAI